MPQLVDFTKITFENPINVSLQIGDSIYVSNILNGGILSTPVFVANVINVGEKFIVIDKDNTVTPIIATGQYISFAKHINVNETSLKGYYADVTLENASNKKIELFAVSSEVVPSSK